MAVKLGDIVSQLGALDTYKLVKGKDVDLTDADAMSADLADEDLVLIDDGALGTQASTKKSALSRFWTYIVGKLSAVTDVSTYSWVIAEDNLVSDSDTKVPTQGSVKAYVDAQVSGSGSMSSFTVSATTDTTPTTITNGEDLFFADGDRINCETTADGTVTISTTATTNQTDSYLLDRANHTGTQTAATISNFDTEVANNSAVTANTAKVSADGLVTTHSDVTSAGSGAIITSAERTKLNGIEALADVTDAANVTSSLVAATTISAQDKTTIQSNLNVDPAGTDNSSPTNITITENASTVTVDSSTGSSDDIQAATTTLAGVMSATDKTKLNGIEASADVTDADNVAAAGAVMESDFTLNGQLVIGGTSGTAIATLTQGSNVTITNGDGSITIASSHPTISAASSSDNSGRTYIQDIILDSNGHVTGIATATETVVNTDTTYSAGDGLDLTGTTFSADLKANGGIVIEGVGNELALDLGATSITGTLSVADGGTNATSFADKSVVITQDTGTDTLSAVPMTTNGQLLIGGTSGPAAATLTQGSNVTITNADGSITIASSHPTISAASSSDNSGRTYIQDIILDSNGHVTGLTTATETVTNTDTKINDVRDNDTLTTISGVYSLRFTGDLVAATGTTGIATVTVGGNIDRLDDVDETITPAAGDVLIYNATSGKYEAQNLTAGSNVSITNGDGSITISATQLTEDQVEDYVGGLIVGGTDITATYNDTAGTLTIDADDKTSYYPTTSGISSNGDASGEIVYLGSTEGLTAGNIYYYNSSGVWTAADADAVSSASGFLGMALGSASATDGMLLRGFGKVNSNLATVGSVVYLSTTAGAGTETAPSGPGDVVRVLGYTVNATTDIMYFNPSPDWIELS